MPNGTWRLVGHATYIDATGDRCTVKIFPGMFAAGLLTSTLYPCQTQAALAPPTNLVARSVSSSQLDVSWTGNANTEIGFQLQFSTNAFFTGATTFSFGPPNRTSLSHTGLGPITTLWYKIKANGPGGSSAWSNTAFATTAPAGVVATALLSPPAVPNRGIKVDWMPNSANTNISGYTVRYSTAAGSCKDRAVAGGNGAEDTKGDLEELLCGASYASDGRCPPAEVQASGVKLMRYGGKIVDNHYVPDSGAADDKSSAQYLTMVDNMRANDIEPLLEVPYGDSDYSATDAADLVRYINITHDRCVRCGTIASEPNRYTHLC
jgi:hypothetical protein